MLNKKTTILIALSLTLLNTHANAGFFDNLTDNLKSGDIGSLLTDAVTDVADEIKKGAQNQNNTTNSLEDVGYEDVEDEDAEKWSNSFSSTDESVEAKKQEDTPEINFGFFNDLADNLKSGDIGELITDAVTGQNNNESFFGNQGFENSNPNNAEQNKNTVVKFSDLEDKPQDSLLGFLVNAVSPNDLEEYQKYYHRYLKGKPFTGKAIREWSNGSREEINYVNGNPEGLREQLYPNGKPMIRYFYNPGWFDKANTQSGLVKKEVWYKNGNKMRQTHLNGHFNAIDVKTGEPNIYWHENGTKKEEESFTKVHKTGADSRSDSAWFSSGTVYKTTGNESVHYRGVWDKDGNKKTESIRKGRSVIEKEWHENGVLKLETSGLLQLPNSQISGLYEGEKEYGYIKKLFGEAKIESYMEYTVYKKEEPFYSVVRNKHGKVTKYRTYQTLPINSGKKSCLYTYERHLIGDNKTLSSKYVASRDGEYLITNKGLYENCLPVAYQACKEGKDSKSCDKLFMQGKYSKEYSYKNDYLKRLKQADLDYVANKIKSRNEHRINDFWIHIDVARPNIYSHSDIEYKEVNGKKLAYYGDILVDGFVVGPRYAGDQKIQTQGDVGTYLFDKYFGKKIKIFEYFEAYKDGELHGNHWTFYPNGRPKRLTNYKNKLKNGPEFVWQVNGYLLEENNYKDGFLDGMQTTYYEKTNFEFIQNAKAPDISPPALMNEYTIFSQWGDTIKTEYSKALGVRLTTPYKNGKIDGKRSKFWPNQILLSEEYVVNNVTTDLIYYEPWEINPETKKQVIFKAHDNKGFLVIPIGRERLAHMDYLRPKYLAGKDPSTLRLIVANMVNEGATLTSKITINGDTKINQIGYISLKEDPYDFVNKAQSLNSRLYIATDNNRVECSVRLEEKGLDQRIIVEMKEDFTDENNIENIASKCNKVREIYHSFQKKEMSSCPSLFKPGEAGELTLLMMADSDRECIEGTYSSLYYVPRKIEGVTILEYPSLAFSSPSPLSPYYDNSCLSSEDEFCYQGIYEKSSLFKNQYIDTTKWMNISKERAKVYKN
jgi:antitoxin component YwqK of YwqJK toxin-antitoxin module